MSALGLFYNFTMSEMGRQYETLKNSHGVNANDLLQEVKEFRAFQRYAVGGAVLSTALLLDKSQFSEDGYVYMTALWGGIGMAFILWPSELEQEIDDQIRRSKKAALSFEIKPSNTGRQISARYSF
jgi:hypothetical protein